MTKKLYYTAPDVAAWTTTVTGIRQDGETYVVTLAETGFYPEGGGQPSDAGTIAGLPVLEVFEENEEVYHRLPAPPGTGAVSCAIDMARRRDHTQQHSGQHLLSAVFIEQLGAETVSFHLGRDVVTIDLAIEALSEQELLAAENRANELIYANLPVETYWVTPEKAERMPFRKRPDVSGNVRVVEIKGIDLSACCGTHVKRTGEIGLIKLLKAERHRGMTRLSFLCGQRALADYQQSHRIVQAAAGRFGTSRGQLLEVIAKWEHEKKELEKRLRQYEGIVFAVEGERAAAKPGRMVIGRYSQYGAKELQTIARLIADRYGKTSLLASLTDWRAVIVKAPSSPLHAGNWLKEQAAPFGGKGGGNERQAQAFFPSLESLEQFLARVETANIDDRSY
ncbi:alanyl-tRNA editing protein [Geobacillus jurassicus]|uniref:DHHA1 domain-containing protein n=1 Tax=Geobacillus jurassicus TaxID=235932 RepID=A0ABV6GRS3_9BACL|nr:DHHA1 domain-containing protein [Geobacillus jurassicus]